jgi:hypothetical protein
MPILILILTAIGGAIWWWVRNNPREALDTAQDMATTVRNAPRRLAFRKQTKEHPVEGIDDPRIAVGAIAQAFAELDDLPTKELRDRLHVLVRSKLRWSEEEAREMEGLGHWLVEQCQDPNQAIVRLSRRLFKIDGDASWDLLQDVLMGVVEGELSHRQTEAVEDIRLALKR